MPQAITILFGAAFTVAVCAALGHLLLSRIPLKVHRGEEHLLAFVAGAPVLSAFVFLACTLRQARIGILLAAGVISIAAAAWSRRGVLPRERLTPLPFGWKVLFGVVFGVYSFLYLSNAMAPEVSPDGITYHLGLVSRYLREAGFPGITTNMYANLSQGVELLFLVAFAFGKHSAASTMHLAFLMALALLMVSYGRRFNRPGVGVCAAIFTFASPVAGVDATSAYIDMAAACFIFTVFYVVQAANVSGRLRDWRVAALLGLLAGFCYAAKYTALLAVPYAFGYLLWRRAGKRALMCFGAAAALMILPWLVKNWLTVENPFSPMLNSVFENPYIHAGFDEEYTRYLRLYDLKGYSEIPKAVTTTGEGGVAGFLGPLFWLAPVGLLAVRRRQGRHVLLAALVFGLPYPLNIGTRFLLPVLPFLSLAMAMAFAEIRLVAPALAILHAVLSWPSMAESYCDLQTWRLSEAPWKAALRIEPEESFFARRLPLRVVAEMIEEHVPPGAKVFSFSGGPEAYTSREIVARYQSAFGQTLGRFLWAPILHEMHPTWHAHFRFPPAELRRIRAVQTASHPNDFWSVAEMRLFSGGQELPRDPAWRLRAHPNRWDVQLAFDNSPVTRWSSWQRLKPGMFLEITFPKEQSVDSVVLEMSHDQYGVALELEGQDRTGRWRDLRAKLETVEVAPPPGLRRAATLEVKARGVRHLLVSDFDHEARDFRERAREWGIRQLAEGDGTRLYEIQ